SFIPAAAIALLLFWMLKGAYVPPKVEAHHHAPRLTDIFRLLRFPAYRSLAYANFTRSFSHFGLLVFLPLYLAEDLGMDSFGVGFHVALLTLLGVGVGPAFGYFSDRIGRRVLILVAFSVIAIGMGTMGIVGSGVPLAIALAFTGIFLWSVQDMI